MNRLHIFVLGIIQHVEHAGLSAGMAAEVLESWLEVLSCLLTKQCWRHRTDIMLPEFRMVYQLLMLYTSSSAIMTASE